jgi:penicillin-binding protein 2
MYSVPEGSKITREEIQVRLDQFDESFPKYWLKRLQSAFQTKRMVRLAEDVPDRVAFVMKEMGELIPGLRVMMEFRRGYPQGIVAGHLIGYLGEVTERDLHAESATPRKAGDLIGKMGIEKTQDEKLRGVDGGVVIEVDSIGKLKRVIRELPFQKGNPIHLTIDAELQRVAEEELAKTITKRGAAVAIDIKTGAILLWASAPTFDPLGSLGQNVVDENRPFFDRVYRSAYPPGSIFKIVTAIAGLERGEIDINEKINCLGFIALTDKQKSKEKIYKCWKRHGIIDFKRAVSESCDSYFYLLGKKIGPQPIYETAEKFGLGQSVQTVLTGENNGNVPNPAWKKKVGMGGWSTGDTLNMAIGQGFVTGSPLQMAAMMTGLATRGTIYRPYMIEPSTPTVWRHIQLKDSTWNLITDALKRVVDQGTGAGINIPYLDVRGKTGTAQNPHGEDHAWFAAYAGYPNEPATIAVCVFVENGGHGGAVAVPIAKRILEAALPPRDSKGAI